MAIIGVIRDRDYNTDSITKMDIKSAIFIFSQNTAIKLSQESLETQVQNALDTEQYILGSVISV